MKIASADIPNRRLTISVRFFRLLFVFKNHCFEIILLMFEQKINF